MSDLIEMARDWNERMKQERRWNRRARDTHRRLERKAKDGAVKVSAIVNELVRAHGEGSRAEAAGAVERFVDRINRGRGPRLRRKA